MCVSMCLTFGRYERTFPVRNRVPVKEFHNPGAPVYVVEVRLLSFSLSLFLSVSVSGCL